MRFCQRLTCLFLTLCCLLSAAWAEEPADRLAAPTQKDLFDSRESVSYLIDVPGRGLMRYYAQNDPLYADVKYENRKVNNHRKFGPAGCVPTALAIALANVLPLERLPDISRTSYLGRGYRICVCSCSPFFCNGKHEQYQLTTPEEFYRYFPLVIGAYACGNGRTGAIYRPASGGTDHALLKPVVKLYQLDSYKTRNIDEVIAGFRQGGVAVIATGTSDSPFSKYGHYLTMVQADDEYVYIMDPFLRDSYAQTDKQGVLELLSPGFVRAKRENLRQLCINSYFLIFPPGVVYTPAGGN